MRTQPAPTLTSPESRSSGLSLLTSDELIMLTDFHETTAPLPVETSSLKRHASRQLPFAVAGLCLVFVSVFSKPLDEREGLWKQPVADIQTAPSAIAANTTVSGWQAFQTWQGILLEDPTPPLDPSILLPQPALAVAQVTPPMSSPISPPPLRGETSMPEITSSRTVTVAAKSPAPAPTTVTASESKAQTTSSVGSTSILAAIFNSIGNAKLATMPVSNGLAASLASASSVAKSLSNLGANIGSRGNTSAASNAGSRGNSGGGGGFGFGGNRRG